MVCKISKSPERSLLGLCRSLADAHAMLKQQEQAEAALAKVLEMNPNFSQAHLELTYPGAILRFIKVLALAELS